MWVASKPSVQVGGPGQSAVDRHIPEGTRRVLVHRARPRGRRVHDDAAHGHGRGRGTGRPQRGDDGEGLRPVAVRGEAVVAPVADCVPDSEVSTQLRWRPTDC